MFFTRVRLLSLVPVCTLYNLFDLCEHFASEMALLLCISRVFLLFLIYFVVVMLRCPTKCCTFLRCLFDFFLGGFRFVSIFFWFVLFDLRNENNTVMLWCPVLLYCCAVRLVCLIWLICLICFTQTYFFWLPRIPVVVRSSRETKPKSIWTRG